ncbi:hypothetical protein JIG36_35545 [Actinoplanes sp. LDG1-06]|uniref:Uncharacterized protein n=1 Tax=Paractinoplanes ovalisporus TaxID=2810368 RepID=A0ABS2AN60_9ACTN|nr:hypothetical protein [Actinoplanes ovalisporus]MBM2620828.1 hypothetical protein [Actinoplanes ovalisporus]
MAEQPERRGQVDVVLVTNGVLTAVGGVFLATSSLAITVVAAVTAVVLVVIVLWSGR